MARHSVETSPQLYARVGGILYLIIIVAGIVGQLFVRGSLVVSGDAAATANDIVASETLWRAGIAGDLIMHVCDVPLALILYRLLKPVHKDLALLALLLNLIQTAALVANKMNLLVPVLLLGNADYLRAFQPSQLQALAYLSVRAHSYGFGIGLIFFGVECLVLGFLIRKSGYLPRILGALLQLAGLSYLANSFALILVPARANLLIMLPAFIAEMSLCLWLIVKGVDLAKWNAALRE